MPPTRKKQFTAQQKAIDDIFRDLERNVSLWPHFHQGNTVVGTLHRTSDSPFLRDVMHRLHQNQEDVIVHQLVVPTNNQTTIGLFGHTLCNSQQDHHLWDKAAEPGATPILESQDGEYKWLDKTHVDYDSLPNCEQWNALRIFGIQAVRAVAAETALRFSPFATRVEDEKSLFEHANPNTIGACLAEKDLAWDANSSFAMQRFQGPNAGRLADADWVDVSKLTTSRGLFYMLDYRDLGQFGLKEPLTSFRPKAIFSCDALGDIVPEYIQVFHNHSNVPFFNATRLETCGWKWRYAKLVMGCAEFNHHEIIDHLTYCHLVTEVFIMATMSMWRGQNNNLIYRLLVPHFSRTLAVNNIAKQLLIPWLKCNLSIFSDEGLDQAIAHSLNIFDCTSLVFDQKVQKQFHNAKLPETYYYGNYGLSLWKELHTFVTSILETYDVPWAEVKEWSLRIRERLPTFPSFDTQNGPQLVDMVCGIIFNASIQHSSINDPQNYFFGFAPNAPCRLMKPVPSDSETNKWKDKQWKQFYFDSLPNKEVMDLQQDLVALLALGPPQNSDFVSCVNDYMTFAPVEMTAVFLQRLKDISADMRTTNRYLWMDPQLLTRSVIR